jgi:hypothetical protein
MISAKLVLRALGRVGGGWLMVTTILPSGHPYIEPPYTKEELEYLDREWFSATPLQILRGPRPRRQPEAERPDQGPRNDPDPKQPSEG